MLCCIFNYAPHYRLPIYLQIGKRFNAHFYFGERLKSHKIEKIFLENLPGFQKELKVLFFDYPVKWEWSKGMIGLAFKRKYNKFLITPNLWAANQWLFLIICLFLGKKVYTWEHGVKSKNLHTIWLIQRMVYYFFIKGVFLYGNKARETMIQIGFKRKKLHVIYNSLDYEKALFLRKELKNESIYLKYFKNNEPVLLFIGRLTKVKKLDLLVAAHNILIKKRIITNVVLIGGGDLIVELKSKLAKIGQTERFWFLGELYDESKISSLLFNATICISPGNVGLTAIHSFSYGLPVITNDNYETQMPEHEIIDEEKTGLFFQEDNPQSLAEKIEWWLKNQKDREKIRQDCYAQIDNYYNPYAQIRIFENVLNE